MPLGPYGAPCAGPAFFPRSNPEPADPRSPGGSAEAWVPFSTQRGGAGLTAAAPLPPLPSPGCLAQSLCSATLAPGPHLSQQLCAGSPPHLPGCARLQGGSSKGRQDSVSGFVCESSCGMWCLQFLLLALGGPFSRAVFKYFGSRVSIP